MTASKPYSIDDPRFMQVLDPVNDWNGRHPDEPFSFTGGLKPEVVQ